MKGVRQQECQRYAGKYRRKAHEEAEYIFRELLPKHGLHVREEQLRLCHEMLDALWGKQIALCDAGVGIGKTYAYLVACIVREKYTGMGRYVGKHGTATGHDIPCQPSVISTSSIALQEAILLEYLPFLSKILLEEKLIRVPVRAVVRKGKEHFVCDSRLKLRLAAVQDKRKNESQRKALFSLITCFDMDQVHGLSGFDRRMVSVPRFCPKNCPDRKACRYHRYTERVRDSGIHFQICNHNYLLADAFHRAEGYRPLLSDYQILVIDEAHKLPEAAGQMCGKRFCYDDAMEICYFLEKEHQKVWAQRIKSAMKRLFEVFAEEHTLEYGQRTAFCRTETGMEILKESASLLFETVRRCRRGIPKWIRNRLEETGELLGLFYLSDGKYILYLEQDKELRPVFCAVNREVPDYLKEMLWERGHPAVLTSGTLKAGNGFAHTRQMMGLSDFANEVNKDNMYKKHSKHKKKVLVQEYIAESPFEYRKNCLLYLPENPEEFGKVRRGSEKEVKRIAEQIRELVYSANGHTMVLFTSYSLMGSVCQLLRDSLPFPMVEVWRHAQEEIMHFKELKNAVLFAAGSCWEGVDFPGDMVSSLIIVRLPFAVPDPVREAEREQYESLRDYIEAVIVPDMQKKLRQGFGRAIRTETDTCVVSILDQRAVKGGKYHEDVLQALPECQMAESLEEVETFILRRKNVDYYM